VIDNPLQVQRLLAQLNAALPLPARPTPELVASLKTQNISISDLANSISSVSYAGDQGGIMCRIEIPSNENAVYVSITHLRFDPKLPCARDIAGYQKHRVKQLKRLRV
jgi:hypothetical protein